MKQALAFKLLVLGINNCYHYCMCSIVNTIAIAQITVVVKCGNPIPVFYQIIFR